MNPYKHIFNPVTIGQMEVKNRIEMAPVGPLLAINGLVTRELIEWGKSFARGGAGIVTLGDSAVEPPVGLAPGNALNLGTDMAVNPLNNYAEAVQRYGAKASIQLNYHSTRSPSEVTLEEIHLLIKYFADAAHRCLKAGMDMIMIHGAHGQLISQFASPRKNLRVDGYGGSVENRARIVKEILQAIREKVGSSLAVEYRISAEECCADGLQIEEQLAFAATIQDLVDLLHVSAGQLYESETLPRMIQPTYIPRGLNVDYAARFKKELKVPVTTVGSLNLEMAEEIVAQGKTDMVAIARALIADPDCVNKAMKGHGDRIRPCVRCNTCINRTHTNRLSVRCAVNPMIGREAEFISPPKKTGRKKVVCVGGGPAGMEAARWAAGLGHEVVLFEKADRLGGTLAAASAAPFKADMRKYLDWAIRSTFDMSGITIELSTPATPERIKAEAPDELIIAVGSKPIVPDIPGINGPNVFSAIDVETGNKRVGDRVVVAGAGLSGSETALFLAREGKQVVLIDMLPTVDIDALLPFINILSLRALLRENGVNIRTEVKPVRISGTNVTVEDEKGQRFDIECDSFVLAFGQVPDPKAVENLLPLAPEVRLIGDCIRHRGNLHGAVSDGFFAAMDIS